ncbi:MAG: cell envelope integrity protein TolA [Candidatus Sulfotelmatobacter sp.]
MKLIGVISTAVLSLAIGVAVPAFAQDHEQEEQKAKPAQDEKKAQPEKSAKQEEKPVAQQEKNAKPGERNAQQEKNIKPEEKNTQQAKPGEPVQRSGNNGGGRIPEDRYRANFGQEHRFRVSQSDYNNRRFQYGGYWFGFEGAWPSNWLYTQDVYVVEINGVYYLCNPMYPGVNVALIVTE